jgi:beta-phosphoglucomutase
MLQAIIFDFDGVLVDSEPLHFRAFQIVGEPLGVTFDYATYLQTYVGFDDRDGFRYMLTGRAEPLEPAMEQRVAALCQQKQQVFDRLLAEGAAAIPGAVALVTAARQAMPIAIASGATAGEIASMLQVIGLAGAFEVIVSADDVTRSKPDAESYALAVQRLRREKAQPELAPAQCLAIEDTPAGLASAKAAGLQTLGLTTTSARDQLAGADQVVDSLAGLKLDQLHAWFGG